ncbi:MAG: hypothetical protein RL297_2334 [Pseudomonadota bacterium]
MTASVTEFRDARRRSLARVRDRVESVDLSEPQDLRDAARLYDQLNLSDSLFLIGETDVEVFP